MSLTNAQKATIWAWVAVGFATFSVFCFIMSAVTR